MVRPSCLITRATTSESTRAFAAYEAALKADKKVYESHMYDGEQHGFHNDTTPRYDEVAAKLEWTRTLELVQQEPAEIADCV